MPGAAHPTAGVSRKPGTRRFDGGVVASFTIGPRVSCPSEARASGNGIIINSAKPPERDFHHTAFVETAVTVRRQRHIWVAGAALQREVYRSQELASFDYTHVVPGVFAQDDYTPYAG